MIQVGRVINRFGREGLRDCTHGDLLGFIPSDYRRQPYPKHSCEEGEKCEY